MRFIFYFITIPVISLYYLCIELVKFRKCDECNKTKSRAFLHQGGILSVNQRDRYLCVKCDKYLTLPIEKQVKIKRNKKIDDILGE